MLEVSRSAYYQHRTGPSRRERDDADLTARIADVHVDSIGTYGVPRVHAELAAQGGGTCKRIVRPMRAAGLCGGRRSGGAPPPCPTRQQAYRRI
ncbi:IS3 family transposase [Micromonospora sp. NPDC092111]|uniref:IS3 family transposase n=1 Tax=Micromonospora sp. NPDC092111 TaxID=3364289 RepID=UPI0037F45910